MTNTTKELCNPFSTGNGGGHFEAHVQASFVALMLTGGFPPCLPCRQITKIKLQAKSAGYDTDDLVVFVGSEGGQQERKFLGQIKHSINITKSDPVFGQVIQAAWNDLNNSAIFTRNQDVIALITGPLSATDINDVRPLLERARHSADFAEFFGNTKLANFVSDGQRTKLQAFQAQLQKANMHEEVSEERVFEFLKHFHLLGYDLDIKAGVTLSLLHSLIGQNSRGDVKGLWSMLVEEVQSANKNAGTLTIETLSEELRTAFTKQIHQSIPAEYVVPSVPLVQPDLSQLAHATELAIASVLGSWSGKTDADRGIVEKLAREDFSTWIHKLRETLQQTECPVSLKDGKWWVIDRLRVWQELGPKLFDENLDAFEGCVVAVLTERDPKFDLASKDRFAASIHNKVLRHSKYLRKGLAETLALLGSHPKALSFCTFGKAETTAVIVVREILADADWLRWASLNDVLPLLAEAAPGEFLDAVEETLKSNPCPFDEVFVQEGDGFMGGNYMSGVLWALETLAWDADHLSRVVVCLGELASRDPGGRWANRPVNSLTNILLPWMPQTCASATKRYAAVSTLLGELPDIGWKLLISLLPQSNTISSGTRKPAWRKTIPDDWTKGVTQHEYREQIEHYSDMALTAAKSNGIKLAVLINHMDRLSPPAREQILTHLGTEAVIQTPEAERPGLWTALIDLITKHRKFSDANWAMKSEQVDKIDALAKRLAPDAPTIRYQRLFIESDFDLFEEKDNYTEQQKKVDEYRQRAIEEINAAGGTQSVLDFAKTVPSPWRVGAAFGCIVIKDADGMILPDLLESENKSLIQFAGGFVWSRFRHCGWQWVDNIDTSRWTPAQIGLFLSSLPFTPDTWERSTRLLGEDESAYWNKTGVNPYDAGSGLESAVDQLMKYGRPYAAIRCLHKMLHATQPFNSEQAVRILLAAAAGSSEGVRQMDAYEIIEIIKALQNDQSANLDDLFKIEWAYLPLLDRHHDASPKLSEQRLANEPEFFCEVIRFIFRSEKEERLTEEPPKEKKNIAENAYRLLSEWQTPPGYQADGTYDGDALASWLEKVKKECAETGHLEVAMTRVGHVLGHAPSDPDGLWIHRSAAAALNAKDANEMRIGFKSELYNSRGAHFVDPTGKPERELASKYQAQAEAVEVVGYHRLATTLRELAASYEREAEGLSSRAHDD